MKASLSLENANYRRGLSAGIAAYLLWGLLPLYFVALAPTGAFEIVAHRIVWSVLFCILLTLITRSFPSLWHVLRSPRLMRTFTIAAVLIAVNWGTYVWSVESHQTADAALGYFINPIVTSVLAVTVLHEKLVPAQIIALILTVVAIIIIVVGTGRLPWVSLVLALSFGLYGLVKNQVGGEVSALAGLTTETVVLFPVALGYLIFLAATGANTWGQAGAYVSPATLMLFLTLSGPVTAIPLLLFAAAARRLPLATLGSLQYLAPVLQLLVAVVIIGEPMPVTRWIGFALVWVGIATLTIDAVVKSRKESQ